MKMAAKRIFPLHWFLPISIHLFNRNASSTQESSREIATRKREKVILPRSADGKEYNSVTDFLHFTEDDICCCIPYVHTYYRTNTHGVATIAKQVVREIERTQPGKLDTLASEKEW